ncbi:ATP-binding protein [Mariniphaga sp.]|uniref:ATP-binding protein n=1 Tax=Mariniphaga sp. TaxID=1954475 RepID=UPI0035623C54
MGNQKIKQFVIENQIKEISFLAEKIEKIAEEWDLSPTLAMNLNLVIEEAVSNIIFYAFPDKAKHEIKISVSIDKQILTIIITDDGIPFNPLKHEQPDINLPAEERPVGGLGIFLMSQIMDEMEYNRKKNENILTLKKSI